MFDHETGNAPHPGATTLAECRRALAGFVDRLDADVIGTAAADGDLTELAAIANLAHTATVLLSRRALESGRWRSAGDRSPAAHLARRLGTTVHAAEKLLATAGALDEVPRIEAEARTGGLSDRQLDAVAEAGAAAPEQQQALVGAARRESVVGLRRVCDAVKAAADDRTDEERQAESHRTRSLRASNHHDGSFRLEFRHTTTAGAELLSLLDPFREAAFKAARETGGREPADAIAADALLRMARAAHGAGGTDAQAKPGRHTKVIVRIDHAALRRGEVEPGETCEITGVGPLPVSAVRELMQDAFIAAVLTEGSEIRKVVHLGRQPTALQRTALEWRDATCAIDGCDATAHFEIDHTVEWSTTRHTTLDELARLCDHHHDLKTFDGWTLDVLDGRRVMRPPDPSREVDPAAGRRAKARRRRKRTTSHRR